MHPLWKLFLILITVTNLILGFVAVKTLKSSQSNIEMIANMSPENRTLLIEEDCVLFSDDQLKNGLQITSERNELLGSTLKLKYKNGKSEDVLGANCHSSDLASDFVRQQRLYFAVNKDRVSIDEKSNFNETNSSN